MKHVLFVSNGHGETAIAERIARQLQTIVPVACDHLGLVAAGWDSAVMTEVGPRKRVPSGGLIAMGNLRNIARDVAAGLIGLTLAQGRFLKASRGTYAVAIAVGDVFALLMALRARARSTVYVGTAKSVYVAAYGRFERAIIRKAGAVFVRDPATAESLRESGIDAEPANVIADLGAPAAAAPAPEYAGRSEVGLFPGSREAAYEDALFLARVVAGASDGHANVHGLLSIAPGLDAGRFAAAFRSSGWRIEEGPDPQKPFALYGNATELIAARTGPAEALLSSVEVVLGQAGTANEAAASAGIPILAFVAPRERKTWYRRRQAELLGDALRFVDRDPAAGARALRDLLADPDAREKMSRAGRQRMGPPGAAAAIAGRIARLCA